MVKHIAAKHPEGQFETLRDCTWEQLEEVRGDSKATSTPHLAPIPTPLQTVTPIAPIEVETEDAIAEEYVEPEHEPESLNLSDLGRQMLEKAVQKRIWTDERKLLRPGAVQCASGEKFPAHMFYAP